MRKPFDFPINSFRRSAWLAAFSIKRTFRHFTKQIVASPKAEGNTTTLKWCRWLQTHGFQRFMTLAALEHTNHKCSLFGSCLDGCSWWLRTPISRKHFLACVLHAVLDFSKFRQTTLLTTLLTSQRSALETQLTTPQFTIHFELFFWHQFRTGWLDNWICSYTIAICLAVWKTRKNHFIASENKVRARSIAAETTVCGCVYLECLSYGLGQHTLAFWVGPVCAVGCVRVQRFVHICLARMSGVHWLNQINDNREAPIKIHCVRTHSLLKWASQRCCMGDSKQLFFAAANIGVAAYFVTLWIVFQKQKVSLCTIQLNNSIVNYVLANLLVLLNEPCILHNWRHHLV